MAFVRKKVRGNNNRAREEQKRGGQTMKKKVTVVVRTYNIPGTWYHIILLRDTAVNTNPQQVLELYAKNEGQNMMNQTYGRPLMISVRTRREEATAGGPF